MNIHDARHLTAELTESAEKNKGKFRALCGKTTHHLFSYE